MHSPRLIDYHMHTAVTIDGKMNEPEACERALSLGIQEIAFTNHVMLNQPDYLMSPEAFVAHWKQIQACQKRYPQLTIRVGIEMDYYNDREKDITESLQGYEGLIGRPFDFVMGSIHELHGIFFSNKNQAPKLYTDNDPVALYSDYFALQTKAVQSRLFDVMAHPDLIKKFTHELTPPLPFETYRPAVELFIDALLEAEVGIEINTKGLKLKVGKTYPSNEILGLYLSKARECKREPILTIGSDAHVDNEVGDYLEDVATTLLKFGQNTIVHFEKRRHVPFEIQAR